jgi:sugar-specific transcriptional regulator TrmB
MKEKEVLQELGMEPREANIYLTLLRREYATASKIAEDIGVDRTTTYDILSRLIDKGLVSYAIKNNVRHFKAAPPQQLLTDLKEKQKHLQKIIPNLLAMEKHAKEETSVELFRGKEGIITVLKSLLRDKKDYLAIGGIHDFSKTIPAFVSQFLKKCNNLGIKGTLICEEGFGDSPEDIIGKHETYKLISKQFVSSTTKIWGDKTAFFVFTEPYHVILIKSKEVADRQRLFFNYLWKQAKEPTKKHKERTLLK